VYSEWGEKNIVGAVRDRTDQGLVKRILLDGPRVFVEPAGEERLIDEETVEVVDRVTDTKTADGLPLWGLRARMKRTGLTMHVGKNDRSTEVRKPEAAGKTTGPIKRIVVGVDGSTSGEAALGFASQVAAAFGASLEIVSAWTVPSWFLAPLTSFGGEVFEGYREIAEHNVRFAVSRISQLQPSVSCTGEAIEGWPASSLLREAKTADLLVVGHNEGGKLKRIVSGSVSRAVSRRAPCSVVIVRSVDR
jgi:nucleotide-binding universal stress UspA family protein